MHYANRAARERKSLLSALFRRLFDPPMKVALGATFRASRKSSFIRQCARLHNGPLAKSLTHQTKHKVAEFGILLSLVLLVLAREIRCWESTTQRQSKRGNISKYPAGGRRVHLRAQSGTEVPGFQRRSRPHR